MGSSWSERPQKGKNQAAFARATSKKPCRWQGEVKRIEDLTNDEIDLWQHLTATKPELRSPFFSLEFSQAVTAAGALARVCLLYQGQRLAGFFPFQFSNSFAKAFSAAERIGGELNDFSGLIIDSSCHDQLRNSDLLSCADLATLEVSHLEESQPKLGLHGAAEHQGARIRVTAEPKAYWSKIDGRPHFQRFKARERKVEREIRSVEFKFSEPEPHKLLPLIMAEKQRQYQLSGRADGFAGPWKRRCLEHIARHGTGRCTPIVSALYFDGEWAALDFSIRAGSVLHSWFPVYNTKFEHFSPGLILLTRRIREAHDCGVDEIDLGEGLSQYKRLFASEFYPVYSDLWQEFTAKGIVYRGYLSALWRFRKLCRLGAIGTASMFLQRSLRS